MSGGEHIPEAAVEAILLHRYGYVRDWPGRRATIRGDLAAALPHLVTEEAVERHARASMAEYCVRGDGELRLYKDEARRFLRAALGIQDEQEVGHDGL